MKILTALIALLTTCLLVFSAQSKEKAQGQDLLIKVKGAGLAQVTMMLTENGAQVESLTADWIRVQTPANKTLQMSALTNNPDIEYVQPNYRVKLLEDYSIQDPLRRAALLKSMSLKEAAAALSNASAPPMADNPEIPNAPTQGQGADPDYAKQWGMKDIGADKGWLQGKDDEDMIVAVIDTGVDYTHEDLVANIWNNPGEIPNNNIDDDGNGFVDDIIGWDFVSNDNKPFDLAGSPLDVLAGRMQPGHGTHCAGNVAARGDNSIGIAGVAPHVKIMVLRFLSEKGEGTTADAIKSIKYAVDNGAKVLSNSWGSEGEDPAEGAENKALREMVQYSQDQGTLFVAAAGNGHQGEGYDNDTDKEPGYPASYDHDNIISVAALDENNELGSFSNWGAKTVDIGAPGVVVYSTTVGSKYSDVVASIGGFEVTWDGTSMATPHVAGAAALYWSAHPEKTWDQVKAALLKSGTKIPALKGKVVSNAKLNVESLMKSKSY